MKTVKLEMPIKLAEHFAVWTFNNQVRVLLAFSKDDFFDAKLIAFCAVEEDKVQLIRDEFKNYVK